MKKLLTLIALTIALIISFTSCDIVAGLVENNGNENGGNTNGNESEGTEDSGEHSHEYGEWVIVTEPTCIENGVKERHCECGKVRTDAVDAKGHSMADGKCSDCGKSYSVGLSFISNGDGTCCVIDIGECQDSNVVIPPVSPDGDVVVEISNGAFSELETLTSIEIPASVRSISYSAFALCTSLNAIEVAPANIYYKDINSNLYDIHEQKLIQYAIGKTDTTFDIPWNVKYIADYAFSGCTTLTSIKIPVTVSSIAYHAFSLCSSLIEINVDDRNMEFTDINGNLYYKDVLVQYAIGKSETSFIIPDGITTINYYAFASDSSLTSIKIPASVTSIYGGAFKDCTSLTDVYYSGSEEEWADIYIDGGNDCLKNATIHYNS